MIWEIAENERTRGGRRKRRARGSAYVSLNRRGEIAMNAEAYRRIKQPASVTLLFDRDARAIGIKYPVSRDRQFFPTRRYGRGRRMRIVRAARALKQFGIEVSETLRFEQPAFVWIAGEPAIILYLPSPMSSEVRCANEKN